MFRFLTDENFNNRIVRGLLRRNPKLDIVRLQDVGLLARDDPAILDWAAENDRIVITHDVSTMTHFAHQRLQEGTTMAGLLEVPESMPIGQAIEEILLIDQCSSAGELAGQVLYLPL